MTDVALPQRMVDTVAQVLAVGRWDDEDEQAHAFHRVGARSILDALAAAGHLRMPAELPGAEEVSAEAAAIIRAVGRRPSHAELMNATDHLRSAYTVELDHGNLDRAREINQLVLACYMAAIRDEELQLPPVGGPRG